VEAGLSSGSQDSEEGEMYGPEALEGYDGMATSRYDLDFAKNLWDELTSFDKGVLRAHLHSKYGAQRGVKIEDIASKDLQLQPTRIETSSMVHRALAMEKVNEPLPLPFKDVETIPSWSLPEIRSTVGNSYMKGYDDGRFGPHDVFAKDHEKFLFEHIDKSPSPKSAASLVRDAQSSTMTPEWFDNNKEKLSGLNKEVFLHEMVAHNLAYKGPAAYNENEKFLLRSWGYSEIPFRQVIGKTGLYMVVFKGLTDDTAPLIAFRGTDIVSVNDVLDDFNPKGVGYDQYQEVKSEIDSVVNSLGSGITVVGHSLGGAHANRLVAYHPGKVSHIATFQSPGINGEEADMLENFQGSSTHYIDDEDLVHLVGEKSARGSDSQILLNENIDARNKRLELADSIESSSDKVGNEASVLGHSFYTYLTNENLFTEVAAAHGDSAIADTSKTKNLDADLQAPSLQVGSMSFEQLAEMRKRVEPARLKINETLGTFDGLSKTALASAEVHTDAFKSRDFEGRKKLLSYLLDGATVDLKIEAEQAVVLIFEYEMSVGTFDKMIDEFSVDFVRSNIGGVEQERFNSLLYLNGYEVDLSLSMIRVLIDFYGNYSLSDADLYPLLEEVAHWAVLPEDKKYILNILDRMSDSYIESNVISNEKLLEEILYSLKPFSEERSAFIERFDILT